MEGRENNIDDIIAAGESKAMSSREKFKVSNENLDIIFSLLAQPSLLRRVVAASELSQSIALFRPGATVAPPFASISLKVSVEK